MWCECYEWCGELSAACDVSHVVRCEWCVMCDVVRCEWCVMCDSSPSFRPRISSLSDVVRCAFQLATKSECHAESSTHMKRYLQCEEQPVTSPKVTKRCACHEKWPSKIWKKFTENTWNVYTMRGRSETVSTMIRPWTRQPATRLATEVTFPALEEHFVMKNTTFRAPAIIPNFTECCACHAKWHCNFTKCCTCH